MSDQSDSDHDFELVEHLKELADQYEEEEEE